MARFGAYSSVTIHRSANHKLQSEALDKNFEKPLRQHLENYRTVVNVCRFCMITPSKFLKNLFHEGTVCIL